MRHYQRTFEEREQESDYLFVFSCRILVFDPKRMDLVQRDVLYKFLN